MKRSFLIVSLAAIGGCASAPPARVTLDATPQTAEQSGVHVMMTPVAHGNWRRDPSIDAHVSWTEPDSNAPISIEGPTPASTPRPMVVRKTDLPLVPLPSLRLQIDNRSGHRLALAHARLTLEDGRGHALAALAPGELQARMEAELFAQGKNPAILDEVRDLFGEVPLVSPKVQVATGASWHGYVTFSNTEREFLRFADGAPSLRVRLSGATLDGAPMQDLVFPLAVDAPKPAVLTAQNR